MSASDPHIESDALDLREIASVLRRGRRWIVGGLLAGIAAGLLATWVLRPQYEATALVILRNADPSTSALSRLSGGLGGLAGSLPMSLESGMETEIEILTSRSVAGAVVDSLHLQAHVVEPRNLAVTDVLRSARFDPGLRESEYAFTRTDAGYRVEGPGAGKTVRPGEPFELPGMTLTLASELPSEFELEVVGREEAIERLQDELVVENTAGEVASLVYRADDRATAAAVPNAILAHYLQRRRTTDRGVNERRFEFLREQVDSISVELEQAEGQLRMHQESSGILDPQLTGEAELERATALRKELEAAEVEIRALQELVTEGSAGAIAPRRLAAYPTFLRNPAINDVLSRLLELDTDRGILLQRRTEADPEVVALTRNIAYLEDQLVSLSRSYLNGLRRQRAALATELERMRAEVASLPGQAEESLRLQREVKRLSETLMVLQAQAVQSRLGAIGEGGDVRQVDVAVPPRKPDFPKWWLNLAVGMFGGVVFGVMAAFSRAYLSPRVRDPRDAEISAAIPALLLSAHAPLLVGGLDAVRGILVLPIGPSADPGRVAEKLAGAAAIRGRSAVLVDATAHAATPGASRAASQAVPERTTVGAAIATADGGGALQPYTADADGGAYPIYRLRSGGEHRDSFALRVAVAELEQRFAPVVVNLPSLADPAAEALLNEERVVVLVGRAGALLRSELRDTVDTLRRAGIPVAGLVLLGADGNGGKRA